MPAVTHKEGALRRAGCAEQPEFPPAATQLHLPFHFLSFRLLQSHRKVCPIIFWLPPGYTPVPLQEPSDSCGRKVMNHVNGPWHNGRLYTFVQP